METETTKPARKPKARGMPGPKSQFRGKDRLNGISFYMTPEGHDALAKLQIAADRKAKMPPDKHVSRSDVIEEAIRAKAARLR